MEQSDNHAAELACVILSGVDPVIARMQIYLAYSHYNFLMHSNLLFSSETCLECLFLCVQKSKIHGELRAKQGEFKCVKIL